MKLTGIPEEPLLIKAWYKKIPVHTITTISKVSTDEVQVQDGSGKVTGWQNSYVFSLCLLFRGKIALAMCGVLA